jgi:galactokinase
LSDKAAFRVHGGGFAGTIQAFVPNDEVAKYKEATEYVFGKGACAVLSIRKQGAVKVS